MDLFDPTLLNSTVDSVTPVLLAALGGLICARAGVFNIALEGLMLTGAFFAVVGSYYSGNAFVGILAAMAAGAVLAAIFALLAIRLRGDVIVIGIALNLLAAGSTVFLLRALFGVQGAFQDPRIQGIGTMTLPGIDQVSVIGPILSGHTWIVYCSWALVAVTYVMLFRHRIGLRLRGVGEQPEAAATLGIHVERVQFAAIICSGLLCGLAGAQLSLGEVTLFVENMSAGRGWIAVVAVMLGQAHPLGVFAASILFGFADSIGIRLQGVGVPSQFTSMLPYVITLAALFIVQARRRAALT
ncbi:MAG TPA: ABC transporter permease [Chloroflexota bacterium]|jgi:simple sugar transport system permease protein